MSTITAISSTIALPPIASWLQPVLWASFYGSILGLIVLAPQPALRKTIPARFRFALWLLVLVRFLPLPMPESRWSLLNWLPHENAATTHVEPRTIAESNAMPATPMMPAAETPVAHAAPVELQAPSPESISLAVTPLKPAVASPASLPQKISVASLLTTLYFAGAAVVLIRLLLATAALRRIVKSAEPVTDPNLLAQLDSVRETLHIKTPIPLLLTDRLTSPALAGLFRPKLLLPCHLLASLSPEELRLVFLHEAAHLHRRDIPLNYAMALLAIAHWFNPILWLLLPRIRAERELACDELVLVHTTDSALYGHTLLKLLESAAPTRAFSPAVGIVESRSFFSRRIQMIASFRKRSAWIALPAIAGLLAAGACVMTSPILRAQVATTQPGVGAPPHSAPPQENPAPENPVPARGVNQSVIPMTPHESAADTATEKKLDGEIDAVRLDKTPLERALAFIRDKLQCSIVINWKALETAGIDRAAPISVDLVKVSARKALQTILGEAGNAMLSFDVEDGVIVVSTSDELTSPAHLVTEVYNVRDLVAETVVASGGIDGSSIAVQQTEILGDKLRKVIQATVAPDAWRDNGGTVATITEFKGLLTITATREMQRHVGELLKEMRAADNEQPGAPKPVATPAQQQAHLKALTYERDAYRKEYGQRASELGEEHPFVILLRKQIQTLDKEIEALNSTPPESPK